MTTLRRPMFFLALLLLTAAPVTACNESTGPCCRTCREGKACGDSCISRDDTCNVGPGCACDG